MIEQTEDKITHSRFQNILKKYQNIIYVLSLNLFFIIIYIYNLEQYPIIFNDGG